MSVFVDSAILWPNRKVYFFTGDQYRAFDIDTNQVLPDYPKPTAQFWHGLDVTPQGAVVWDAQKAYFFNTDKTLQYDIANDAVDVGFPAPTVNVFQGLLAGPQADHKVDVATLWPNGSAYFFQYDRYYRVNVATKRIDAGYPLPILNNWPGLWLNGQYFTGGFVWPDLVEGKQKAYFFQKLNYFRYDVETDKVDPGYPKLITGNWPGM
jgi:hypothetical protein